MEGLGRAGDAAGYYREALRLARAFVGLDSEVTAADGVITDFGSSQWGSTLVGSLLVGSSPLMGSSLMWVITNGGHH